MPRTSLMQCYRVTVKAMRVYKRRSRALQDTSVVEMKQVIRDCGLKSLYVSVPLRHVPRGNKSRPPYPRHTTWHRVMWLCTRRIVHDQSALFPFSHACIGRQDLHMTCGQRAGYQRSYMRESESRAVLWCQPPSLYVLGPDKLPDVPAGKISWSE